MKKVLLLFVVAVTVATQAFAGGFLTNTNQSVSYLRMLARGASSDIDAVYYNPAGLSWMKKDGFAISLNIQSAYQNRNIYTNYNVYNYLDPQNPTTKNFEKLYHGKAKAPVLPSLFVTYKKNKWVASAAFGVYGGGGNAKFGEGLPMFDSQIHFGMANNQALGALTAGLKQAGMVGDVHDLYTISSALNGKQILYGVQLGATYQATDWLAVFAGIRFNYFQGGYDGYLYANLKQDYMDLYKMATGSTNPTLTQIVLDCEQSGFGVTPIIGASVKFDKFTFGAKYEFMCDMEIENKTNELVGPEGSAALDAYKDGVKTANDIPGFLAVAAGYEFFPYLRMSLEYHRFMDKKADMAGGKEQFLNHGTNEYLAGLEWDVCKFLTLSAGYQRTDMGMGDKFQSDVSFNCNSHTVGFGGALNVCKNVKINLAYMFTKFQDYKMGLADMYAPNVPSITGIKTYKRTSNVFGIGVDYTF